MKKSEAYYFALTEVRRQLKKYQKKTISEIKTIRNRQLTLEVILNSGVLSVQESTILREYFEYRGSTVLLNENTIKLVDREFLNEGAWGWLKSKGKQALDWLNSGWDKVKQVWKNFTDFTKSLAEQVKKMFKNLINKGQAVFEKSLNWLKSIPSKVKSGSVKIDNMNLVTEESSLLAGCVKHIKNFMTLNIEQGKGWEKQVIDGTATPSEEVNENYIAENIFEDKQVINALYKMRINEEEQHGDGEDHGGHAVIHPEDAAKKYPALKKVVKWFFNLLNWVFNPLGTYIKKELTSTDDNNPKMLANAPFNYIAKVSGKIKGPTGEFVALGVLLTEVLELTVKKATWVGKGWTNALETGIQWVTHTASLTFGWHLLLLH